MATKVLPYLAFFAGIVMTIFGGAAFFNCFLQATIALSLICIIAFIVMLVGVGLIVFVFNELK